MPRRHIHNGGKGASMTTTCPNCNTTVSDREVIHTSWDKATDKLVKYYQCPKCKRYFTR